MNVRSSSLLRILIATVVAGLLIALALAPVAGISGAAVQRTNETMQSNLADMTAEELPGVTTINDRTGTLIAHVYDQRRHPVSGDQISQAMKDAIVAIEDRRFYEHEGVDFQGFARAMVTNLMAGGVEEGASTINQQYVKNYLLHVAADSTEAQAAATEQSIPRKLREMRMAAQLDKELTKDEVLTRYLNVVPFGNHAYGVEAAARTYFGIPASDLSVPQAAMLAGMVQSSEYLNPYTNTDAVIERRNTVLQAMVEYGAISQEDADAWAAEPLGVLESPALLGNGCIAAGDRGFFCDYVINYLEAKGISEEQILNDELTITTTLDPTAQDAAHDTVTSMVDPAQPGVAEVLNVVEPGTDSRPIRAMTSSRNYGLDLEAGETYLPQPTSLVGNGAGSVFKIFTAAAAMEAGRGLNDVLPVPERYEAQGLGAGGAANCPANTYCVENAGTYQDQMTLEEALAYSPNTTFVMLIDEVGVPAVVDMSVKLGLRSYEAPQSYNEDYSIADYFKKANLGSYTLGPTAVNALELSNVGATLSSQGRWCEPNPIATVETRDGEELHLERPECEQVVEPELANALSQAMVSDVTEGTARNAAQATGFGDVAAAKTGTTESNQSSAFLGFNNAIAAAPYIFNDGTGTSPLCTSPVRQCGAGNLYGGQEPAQTYFTLHQRIPQAIGAGVAGGPAGNFREGAAEELFADLAGSDESAARAALEDEGFEISSVQRINSDLPAGTVVAVERIDGEQAVTLILSNGQSPSGGGASDNASDQPAGGDSAGDDTPPSAPEPPQGPSTEELDRLREELESLGNDLRNQFGL
ncbi:penicillin-binding protein [Corynebacterium yudongzhengii]|uniref:Penicillin-binding protein n=1 Tax=Corynebacterium yudongzhengii TaxID=2080740 RepID=A0A2U1T5G6_9CORY|nr:transglycosylase domain-containing protein [Corynebacterium yudongzhengii]AWB81076.1 penicillin-binding protein [Corynebacterium yudongzhengii]PWC01231.1 penicillin-binding protein [Corynebacterium yudongzhengii]